MRSTFKVLFYVKKGSEKPNGNLPLMCRITVDGKESRFSMKTDVDPNLWDVRLGKMRGRHNISAEINALVDNTKAVLNRIYHQEQERTQYVSAEKVKNIFLGIDTRHYFY